MKILITINHYNSIGGSETWVDTVKSILSRKHDVDLFIFNDRKSEPKKNYDLVICNHSTCFHYVKRNINHDRLVFVSHGIVNQLENPPLGADKYYSVSEEVQAYNRKTFNVKSDVLRNPIDLNVLVPTRGINLSTRKILGILQGETAGLRVKELGYNFRLTPIDRFKRKRLTRADYNYADIVFSLGRGCFEALACGRPVIVYDSRPYQGAKYDGLVTKKNFSMLVQYNCSGRALNGKWNRDRVLLEMDRIVPDPEYYRSIAEKYFDGEKICKTLIG